MTEEQKDILIAKMLDAPDSLSEEELDMILLDDELKDIYEASALVSGALASKQEFDVEQEWRLFRHRIMPKPSLTRRLMRVAAIFLGVVIVSGIIAKVIDYSLTGGGQEQMAEVAKPTTSNDRANKVDTPKMLNIEPVAEQKEVKKPATTVITKATRKVNTALQKEEEEIDVDEYLRQQQEEIEEEIIRYNAEIYVDEYYAMREFISGMNIENPIITE